MGPQGLLTIVTSAALVAVLAAAPTAGAASCPNGATCATVTVPLDRANASAGTIDVAYTLVPHSDTGSPALSTVVTNPGGPGQSTIASASLYLQGAPELFVHHDLLLVDPRGTGGSGALTCPSLTTQHPFDIQGVAALCGPSFGSRAGRYGSADVADDIEAVRVALGIDKIDLWGDSYGTFLMQVFAARHPEHVRSIVLDGAFPIDADPWGRDIALGLRRVVPLACTRLLHCSGSRLLTQIATLAAQLRRHPVKFAASSPRGRLTLTVGERELANLTYADGRPERLKPLPAAVKAGLQGRFGPLKRMVVAERLDELETQTMDQTLNSELAGIATMCHDYVRPYDLAASPATRRAQYRKGLRKLDPKGFWPFSPDAWLRTRIDAGPKCVDWPADPTAGAGLQGLKLPDVPVLVMSGDLDSDTPVEQGRVVAKAFPHARFAIVANAGHTPAVTECGVGLGVEFVEKLTVDANRCRKP